MLTIDFQAVHVKRSDAPTVILCNLWIEKMSYNLQDTDIILLVSTYAYTLVYQLQTDDVSSPVTGQSDPSSIGNFAVKLSATAYRTLTL
jgi:hypothetical protein